MERQGLRRRLVITGVFLALLLPVSAALLVLSSSSSANRDINTTPPKVTAAADTPLQGITAEDLANSFWVITPADSGARITAQQAIDIARSNGARGTVLETVLVYWTNNPQYNQPRLVWAVNYDPSTVEIDPHGGPCCNTSPRPEFSTKYAISFVDAITGEWLTYAVVGQPAD